MILFVAVIYLLFTDIDQLLSNGWRDVESLVQIDTMEDNVRMTMWREAGQTGCVAMHAEGRQRGWAVNVKQQSNVTVWLKEPTKDLIHVCVQVHVWQMYLRLSARPSVSISPDRVLTAVQCLLSMCWQTVNPMEVLCRQSLWQLFPLDSPHLPFPLSFTALFSFLSLSPFNQSKQSFSEFHCLLHPPKPHLLFYRSPFCHNPCPQFFTPSYPTVHNPPMQNPHIACSTT